MKFISVFCSITVLVCIISCGTQNKTPYYLENISDTIIKEKVKYPELRIQANDELSIQVYDSSKIPGVSTQLFNLNGVSGSTGNSSTASGFLVDGDGNIEYPRIGVIHVEGLTKKELADIIRNKFSRELTGPVVIIRFINFKITMLGELINQGQITSKGDKINILEAIGQAGGITDYGNRKTVKVIRDDGSQKNIGIIDLSSKEIFNSPYFNLVQNDIVLVDPTKQKARLMDQTRVTQQVSFALSVITAVAVIFNIFK